MDENDHLQRQNRRLKVLCLVLAAFALIAVTVLITVLVMNANRPETESAPFIHTLF